MVSHQVMQPEVLYLEVPCVYQGAHLVSKRGEDLSLLLRILGHVPKCFPHYRGAHKPVYSREGVGDNPTALDDIPSTRMGEIDFKRNAEVMHIYVVALMALLLEPEVLLLLSLTVLAQQAILFVIFLNHHHRFWLFCLDCAGQGWQVDDWG